MISRAAFNAVAGLSVGLVAVGAFVAARSFASDRAAPGRAALDSYAEYLEREARLCFVAMDPSAVVCGQACAAAAGMLASAILASAWPLLVPVAAAVAPTAFFAARRRARSAAFTAQADGFILALANSLRAVPNVSAALAGVVPVLQDPIKQEVVLALNEIRVGSSVDQALLNASARARSPAFDGALAALLIGRQVGGDLPKILETTAATIREMNRLAGVVRSKTSESRAQLSVLAGFPAGIIVLFSAVSPGFFDPLEHTTVGNLVAAAAFLLWTASILVARQFSKVDL